MWDLECFYGMCKWNLGSKSPISEILDLPFDYIHIFKLGKNQKIYKDLSLASPSFGGESFCKEMLGPYNLRMTEIIKFSLALAVLISGIL